MPAIWEQKNSLRRSIVELAAARFAAADDIEKLDMWKSAVYLLATTKSLKELKRWHKKLMDRRGDG